MAAGTRRLTGGQPTCSRGLTASTWPPPTVSTARWGPARMMVPQLNTMLPAVTPMGMGRLQTEKRKLDIQHCDVIFNLYLLSFSTFQI